MFNLAGTRSFRSKSVDETQGHIAAIFQDHILDPLDRSSRIDARVSCEDLGKIGFVEIAHGADVLVDPEALSDFYLLQIPISGRARYEIGDNDIETSSGKACLISPGQRVKMRYDRAHRQRIVKIDRSFLEQTVARETGHGLRGGVSFDPLVDLSRCEIRNILSLTEHLSRSLLSGDPIYRNRSIQDGISELLVRSLLRAQGSNYWDDVCATKSAAVHPGSLKRAERFVEQNLQAKLAPSGIAAAAGTSVRSLYRLFRECHGVTPMEYVKESRLKAIRRILGDPKSSKRIGEIAMDYGFDHIGHFCASYRAMFGELPQETVRRTDPF